MSLNRYAARNDANHTEIVCALEAAGCMVWVIRTPVDLLVGVAGRTGLVEIKHGAKPASRRKYTPMQAGFLTTWNGGPVFTVLDVAGALRAAAVLKGLG